MNFFGHAAVAAWTRSEPEVALGAMLPDFATMLAAAPPECHEPLVSEGIALHHRTDAVFHQSQGFRALERQSRRELRDAGLPRGTALALAHVGVEMLLDLVLAREPGARAAYGAALLAGKRTTARRSLRWHPTDRTADLDDLVDFLLERRVHDRLDDRRLLGPRLERALRHRPRLALPAGSLPTVERWLEHAAQPVERAAPALVRELRGALCRDSTAHGPDAVEAEPSGASLRRE